MSTEVIDKGQAIETVTGEIVVADQAPRQPWDRCPNESSYWYDAFLVYRSLPPHERSIITAYRESRRLQGRTDYNQIENASGDWYKQSKAWNWDKRSALYDDHVIKQAEAEAEKAVRQWYAKSRFDLIHIWNDLRSEYDLADDGQMSKSQVTQAMKTVNQLTVPQSPNQSVDVQIILDKLPADIQTALLHDLRSRK